MLNIKGNIDTDEVCNNMSMCFFMPVEHLHFISTPLRDLELNIFQKTNKTK